jgi:hypothetical protein
MINNRHTKVMLIDGEQVKVTHGCRRKKKLQKDNH